jgi:hypothetical protein
MDNYKCPICRRKVDQVLVPEKDNNCLIICENEFVAHGVCTNGTMLLFRKNRTKEEELKYSLAYD